MHKKDYELIAQVLHQVQTNISENPSWNTQETDSALCAIGSVVHLFAHELKADNERFDTDRFLEAALF